jgi:tRNA-modifying protein YgfZ
VTSFLSAINITTFPGIFWWKPACWLRATGPDAASFLQGQFTNDLRLLGPGRASYGLWLDVKGKVIADSFVVRGAGESEFWIGSYFCPATTIMDRLERNLIADDVVLENVTADWTAVSLIGHDANAVPPADDVFAFAGRRARESSRDWVFPAANLDRIRAVFAASRELTSEEIAWLRVGSAIPAIPVDVGPADLPNEAGLEQDAISYTKGCYLGQEVMARLKTMGQVRRKLLRVTGPAPVPHLPLPLYIGGRQVGELRSAATGTPATTATVGLAMLQRMHLVPEAQLATSAGGEPSWCLIDPL